MLQRCDNLEGEVAEKQEEFEDTLWKWQEYQAEIESCFENLVMMDKSIDLYVSQGHIDELQSSHMVKNYRRYYNYRVLFFIRIYLKWRKFALASCRALI